MNRISENIPREENPTGKDAPGEKEVKIVEFQEHHAPSLAEMWNVSKEEWGGQDGNRTAEQVKTSLRNAGNLKDFVALIGNTVVGYCSFSQYEDDEGASYIPLLNVRPEYHGKKIGKKLLLRALEVAVEQGWPRMDLYTWSSNLKAVPLYKKCGFFWEKENPYIHLMNFMPTVLNTEAITEYLRELHWYDHVARDLSVEPDGRVEKGFHFYQYRWENEKEHLKVEFCRRGRGLRLIDTKDYRVECYTNKNTFPFGKAYPVYYRVINKTSRPLTLELKGRDDKNIRYDFEGSYRVTTEEIIEGEFFIGEISELYPELLTHPCITTEMRINGKKAEFKLGIVPKFPLDLSLKLPHTESFPGQVERAYLDMENGFDEPLRVDFTLEDSPELQWEEPRVSLSLKAGEKKSLLRSFRVKSSGFYQREIPVRLTFPEETLPFKKQINSFIRGRRGKYYGETDGAYSVVNGKYKLSLEKHENMLVLEDLESKSRDVIFYPKLGLPFNTDFSSKLPDGVSHHVGEESIILQSVFDSKAFSGLRLHSLSELYPDGIVKQHYEVENTAGETTNQEVWVSASLYHPFADSCFSYDHRIIKVAGMEESRLVYYHPEKFTENWIYAAVGKNSWGMVWPRDTKLEQEGPFLKVNENLGKLEKGGKRATKPVYMLYNAMGDWKELRRFALGNARVESEEETIPQETLEITLQDHNPFVSGDVQLSLALLKEDTLTGRVRVDSRRGSVAPEERIYQESQGLQQDRIKKVPSLRGTDDTLAITADLKKTRKTYHREIFLLGEGPVEKTTEASRLKKEDLRRAHKIREKKVYRVHNGRLGFACDPDYLNGVFSVTLDQKEYLHSPYPRYASKFPWNPWSGGIYLSPEDHELEAMLQENRRGEFTTKVDNKGNPWEGIKVTTEMINLEKYKGLTLHQYFLTLPGIPVLTTVLEIEQKTGGYLGDLTLQAYSFFGLQPDLTETYFGKADEKGAWVDFKAGKYQVPHNAKEKYFELGSFTASEKVQVFAPGAEHLVGFANKEILEITGFYKAFAPAGTSKTLAPQFMIFTDRRIPLKDLEDLRHIRF